VRLNEAQIRELLRARGAYITEVYDTRGAGQFAGRFLAHQRRGARGNVVVGWIPDRARAMAAVLRLTAGGAELFTATRPAKCEKFEERSETAQISLARRYKRQELKM